MGCRQTETGKRIFSSPGRSPGRAGVLILASALAAAAASAKCLSFLCDGQGAVR